MTLTVAQAFYIPPATGFRSDMSSEFKVLNQAGVSTTLIDVLALCPSLKSMKRGLSSPEGELEFWRKCCEELTSFLEIHAVKNLPLVLVGFNFGGSLAAYLATNLQVNALIASGSVPRLSDFWENSEQPVARNSRETHFPMDPRFSQITRHLDLTESVLKLPFPVLIQFGKQDEWIALAQARELEAHRPGTCTVTWRDDDHDMVSDGCIDERLHFILNLVKVPALKRGQTRESF